MNRNESPHSSLGFLTPFEVYFGRPANRQKNKLFLDEKRDFQVQEENIDEANCEDPTEEELNNLDSEQSVSRKKLWMLRMAQRKKWSKEN